MDIIDTIDTIDTIDINDSTGAATDSTGVQPERRGDRGFTLVELLIVIVILGILSTVTVFAVRGITDQGKTSACEADQRTLETAIEAYFAQNGSSVIAGGDAEATLVSGGFLRKASDRFNISSSGVLSVQAPAGSSCII